MTTATRFVAFGGSRIRIDYDGPVAAAIVDFLFRDTHDHDRPDLQATFRVEEGSAEPPLTIRRDDEVLYRGADPAVAARVLQESTSYSLAAGSTSGILMHAAAASRDGRVLMFPGTSGAGKTTLTAWLISSGFEYLTDELALVRDQTRTVEALTRPLNVKPTGFGALPPESDEGRGWALMRSPLSLLCRPPLASVARADEPSPVLTAIVFPRYDAAAGATLEPVAAARAGLRLMGCLLNARNPPEHGFPDVAALARDVPSYELTYGAFDAAEPLLLDLVR